VLAVHLGDEDRAKLEQVFGRSELGVELAESSAEAVRAARRARFDAVLIGDLAGEDELLELLADLRAPESASAGAAIALLLPPSEMPFARAYVSAGANQVVSSSLGAADLQAIVLRLLHAKVRLELRVMARLTVQLGGATSQVLCQTRDLSRTGMYVVTDARPPIGSPLAFVLELPRSGVTLHGEARVVRHVERSDQQPEGIGLHFVRFAADGDNRLAAFLEQARDEQRRQR